MMASIVLADIVNPDYQDPLYLDGLGEQFTKEGYVALPKFFTPQVIDLLNGETLALHAISTKRDFTMSGYETPRLLSVAGGKKILGNTVFIPSLYIHHQLQSVLSRIVGKRLFTVKHQEECIVANYLDGNGQTHGWHLDDPMYALIIILEAPAAGLGGCVEYIPGWMDMCATLGIDPITRLQTGLDHAQGQGLIRSVHLKAGDCYILNAGMNLHRVTPVADDSSRRRVINMAFDHRERLSFGETADILYAEEEVEHVYAV